MSKALLMADVIPPGAPAHEAEAEPITVEVHASTVLLELDDGTRLIVPLEELRAAIEQRKAEAA